jgi:hypothetical protein
VAAEQKAKSGNPYEQDKDGVSVFQLWCGGGEVGWAMCELW